MVWYPGHMAKARALVRENIKLVDLVVEVVDARAPLSSANPELEKIVGSKPRVVVLNKADLASAQVTGQWQDWFNGGNQRAVALEAITGRGVQGLLKVAQELVQPTMEKLIKRGRRPRPARLLIVGIPNVGKSSLLNRLAGKKRSATGARPGITRGKQWVKVREELELLDTPGILWPRVEDPEIGVKLAAIGALPLEEVPVEQVAFWLLAFLQETSPSSLQERYKIPDIPNDPHELLEVIGRKRGMLLPGGVVDEHRVITLLLKEYQEGLLGRHTLERPPEGEVEWNSEN